MRAQVDAGRGKNVAFDPLYLTFSGARILYDGLAMNLTVNAQKERKSLMDDSSPVNSASAGKLIAGRTLSVMCRCS
jgi:hypothetical protein